METFIGAGEAARKAGAKKPRNVSDLFAEGKLDAEKCPIVAGCRMIPESMLPEIQRQLHKKGWLTLAAEAEMRGEAAHAS
ncbi:MAG TPA: hypothetical protein VH253_10915 [Phycisphaerae bacterium]|nr:hypothetical protein [Phycisphaerae bacterium]